MKVKANLKETTTLHPDPPTSTINTSHDTSTATYRVDPYNEEPKSNVVDASTPKTIIGTPAAPDDQHFMKSGPEYGHQGTPASSIQQPSIQVDHSTTMTGEPYQPEGAQKFDSVWDQKAAEILTKRSEAEYPWDQCISDRLADGYDEDSAKKICAAIKNRTVSHSFTEVHTSEPTPGLESPSLTTPAGSARATGGIADAQTTPPSTVTNAVSPSHSTTLSGTAYKPTGAPSSLPSQVQTSTVLGTPPITQGTPKALRGSVPIEQLPSLEERKARIQAELKAKTAEEQALIWEQKHNEVYKELSEIKGRHDQLSEMYRTVVDERDGLKEGIAKATIYSQNYDKLNKAYTELSEKYNNTLKKLTETLDKWTKADEDYLIMAKKVEDLEGKLQEARKDAKKIVRIKA